MFSTTIVRLAFAQKTQLLKNLFTVPKKNYLLKMLPYFRFKMKLGIKAFLCCKTSRQI